ncbi:MAG: hypothetical protein WCY11_05965, partial [Novosphingobium sp.]
AHVHPRPDRRRVVSRGRLGHGLKTTPGGAVRQSAHMTAKAGPVSPDGGSGGATRRLCRRRQVAPLGIAARAAP